MAFSSKIEFVLSFDNSRSNQENNTIIPEWCNTQAKLNHNNYTSRMLDLLYEEMTTLCISKYTIDLPSTHIN